MDENRLKAVLQAEIDDAIGYIESETTYARTRALEYYLREPYGNEVEGRSQIVTGEVAEVVDGMLPQLMRVFTASDEVVRFEPMGPGDEEGAQQATDYANWVFYRDNPGFAVMHDWFKDALLQKVGVVKHYWCEKVDLTEETYRDLSDDELVLLLSDGTREIVAQETEESVELVAGMDGAPVEVVTRSHNVVVQKRATSGRIVVENVPPEEFLIAKRARTIEDAPFCAHRKLVTRSDLIAMGYDPEVVNDLPTYSDLTFNEERVARYPRGEQPDVTQTIDPSMQTVEVYECYIYAGFGDTTQDATVAQLRRVVYAGNEILSDEPWDMIPFSTLCPLPVPHKFFGECPADRVLDLQLIKSTLTRQMLDNLYLTNNARVGVVDGQVNLDDLMTVTPGGVVRMKNPSAIVPMTVQPVIAQAFPMLEYLDGVQQKRSGVSEAQQGLDPNVLQNVTAAAVAAMTQAAAGKTELIARIFAETGVKRLFRSILHLLMKYSDKPRLIRMRGKFIPVDPRTWANEYDLSVNVGLGTGSRQEQLAMLQMVLAKQEQMLAAYGPANPLVSLGQYRSTLGKLIEAAGFKDSSVFFKPITPEQDAQLSQPQPQQPQMDPAIMAQVQSLQAATQADIQAKAAKTQAEIALMQQKTQAEIQRKQMELEAEIQLKAAKQATAPLPNVAMP